MHTSYTRSADRNLIAEGYKFFPSQISPEIVTVAKPNGGSYTVDLRNGTCDCAAGKRGVSCCHKREVEAQNRTENRPQMGTEAYRKMVSADFD